MTADWVLPAVHKSARNEAVQQTVASEIQLMHSGNSFAFPSFLACGKGKLAELPADWLFSPARPLKPSESEMLQSVLPAQTADIHTRRYADSAIPAEVRARQSNLDLELSALSSHLLPRSVPGLPFASSKLLRSAQPFEPGFGSVSDFRRTAESCRRHCSGFFTVCQVRSV